MSRAQAVMPLFCSSPGLCALCVLCFGNSPLPLKLLPLKLWEQKFLGFAGAGVTSPRDSRVQGKDLWGGDISDILGCLGVVCQMDFSFMGILMEPCGVQVAGTVLPQSLMVPGNPSFCLFAPLPHTPLCCLVLLHWFY